MVNLPLITDMLALRIAATDDDDSGWIDQPEAGRENVNASRVKTWRARALFRPVDNLSINASYWRYASRYQSGNNATDAGTEPVSGVSFASTPGYELKGISATWDLDAFTVFYGYSENHYARLASGNQFDLTIDIDVAAHELRWTSTARTLWRWTGGIYRRASVRRDDFVYPGLGLDQRDTTSSTAESVFGEVTWIMPTFPLEASLGLRHFRDRLAGVAVSSAGTSQVDREVFSSNNPRLSLAYRQSEDARIYASASKGFRSGQRRRAATN